MDRVRVREGAERTDPGALEGFVRALVGVRDASLRMAANGRIAALWIVPAEGVPERQIRLNIVSALMAGPGLALDPAALRFTSSLPDADAEPATEVASVLATPLPKSRSNGASPAATHDIDEVARPSSVAPPGPGDHDGSSSSQMPEPEPVPAGAWRVVRFEIEHPAPGRIRVIVGVAARERQGLGVREGDDRPGTALTLSASAAADAARSAGASADAFQLAGVAISEVAGRPHVVAAVDVWTGRDFAARPGAAAVLASYEEAAARAVLAALCRY